jgi:hypothetical protein
VIRTCLVSLDWLRAPGPRREDPTSAVLATAVAACSAPVTEVSASSTDEALAVEHLDHVTTLSYAPHSFVIGNAYAGWTDEVQGSLQFSRAVELALRPQGCVNLANAY